MGPKKVVGLTAMVYVHRTDQAPGEGEIDGEGEMERVHSIERGDQGDEEQVPGVCISMRCRGNLSLRRVRFTPGIERLNGRVRAGTSSSACGFLGFAWGGVMLWL